MVVRNVPLRAAGPKHGIKRINTAAMTTTIVKAVTHTAPTTNASPDVLGRTPAGPCVGIPRFGATGAGASCNPRNVSAALGCGWVGMWMGDTDEIYFTNESSMNASRGHIFIFTHRNMR